MFFNAGKITNVLIKIVNKALNKSFKKYIASNIKQALVDHYLLSLAPYFLRDMQPTPTSCSAILL